MRATLTTPVTTPVYTQQVRQDMVRKLIEVLDIKAFGQELFTMLEHLLRQIS